MPSIGDFALIFNVRWEQFLEERRVRALFYKNEAVRQSDCALRRAYRFSNPYRISRLFLQKRGDKEVHLYGETPLTVLDRIAQECGLTANDHFLDLGCGRGRGVFFLAHRYGCRASGIEWISAFIDKAKAINQNPRVTFAEADMLEADLSEASVIYLYGTCLEDAAIEALLHRFAELPKGTKIITVSYSLLDYTSAQIFFLSKKFTVLFPWGEGEIFIHEKT